MPKSSPICVSVKSFCTWLETATTRMERCFALTSLRTSMSTAKPELSMVDRDVLIVDDIFDEGHTLAAIVDYCKHAGARAVHTAVLIDKEHDRKARPDLNADYVGLPCVDRYIFGYGMDYKGYWRNAPGIYAVKGM